MTANVFGTPVYVFSADDPANKAGKGKDGNESVSGRLKDVIKTLQPLEKAQSALENAAAALDGTGYEELQQSIKQVIEKMTATTNQIVSQLSGNTQQVQPQAQPAPQGVPTAGQIAGTEPLPDNGMAAKAGTKPAMVKKSQNDIERAERQYLMDLAAKIKNESSSILHESPQKIDAFINSLAQVQNSLNSFVKGNPPPSQKYLPAAQALLSAINVAIGTSNVKDLPSACARVISMMGAQ